MIVSTTPKLPNEVMYRVLNIQEYHERRNKILILRDAGGLGDILMHRMMFEDFHLLMPDCELHFACPTAYHDAVRDHPFVSKVLDSKTVKRNDYVVSYNTTTACGRYEGRKAPLSDLNRSDIWARHCGLNLTKHDMHIKFTEQELSLGREYLEKYRNKDGEIVLICPVSAMGSKNLSNKQLAEVISNLTDYCVICLHNTPIPNVQCISGVSIRLWMTILYLADYVISVDTAAFHCRGGMQKPILGIFTWASGETYGIHYNNKVILQGPCPLYKNGCYTWNSCPVDGKSVVKPCLKDITTDSIMDGFNKLIAEPHPQLLPLGYKW